MRLDVYSSDADAFEAAASLAAVHLRAAVAPRLTVALAGGRSGRGVMVALAAHSDLPWDRIDWFWGDECCVPADDPRSHVRLARESMLEPRAIAATRVHVPPVTLGDPERIAAAYAAMLAAGCDSGVVPTFDLVLLGLGGSGRVAALMPGSAALHALAPVAAVSPAEVVEEPHVARVTVTPVVLRAARRVIVVAAGDGEATALARTMRDPFDPDRVPAQLVRPGPGIDWVVDRAAAAELLRDARPAAQ